MLKTNREKMDFRLLGKDNQNPGCLPNLTKKKSPRRGRAETTRGNIDDTAANISISLQNPAVEVFYFFNFFIRQLVSVVCLTNLLL